MLGDYLAGARLPEAVAMVQADGLGTVALELRSQTPGGIVATCRAQQVSGTTSAIWRMGYLPDFRSVSLLDAGAVFRVASALRSPIASVLVEGAPSASYLSTLYGTTGVRLPLASDMVVFERMFLPFGSAYAFEILGQTLQQWGAFWFHWYELPDPTRIVGSPLDA